MQKSTGYFDPLISSINVYQVAPLESVDILCTAKYFQVVIFLDLSQARGLDSILDSVFTHDRKTVTFEWTSNVTFRLDAHHCKQTILWNL
jgi:hypothetical protein